MSVHELNKQQVRLGFIGLGIMGSRLTRRLHSAGWNVQAWNRSPEPAVKLQQSRVRTVASITDLVRASDVILSCLANDAAVRTVYFDRGGVFASAKPGMIVLEMSTISSELSRLLHKEASRLGIRFLDVAISGSAPAVEAGTVTLLAGGEQSTFEQCWPIYETLAKQWFLMGEGGAGVRMKLVVNLLLGIGMQGIAEAVSLGEHLQLDRTALLNVLAKTTVIPPALVGKLQKIEVEDYSPQFPLRLMSKDMKLIMEMAKDVGAELPAAGAAKAVLDANLKASGDLDLSAIAPFVLHLERENNEEQAAEEVDQVCVG